VEACTLECAPGTEPNSRPLLADRLRYSFYNVQRKFTSLLNATSILVCTLVAVRLQELVNQVPIRSMDLDTIKACSIDRVFGRLGKELHVFLNFLHCQSSRGAVFGVQLNRRGGDVGVSVGIEDIGYCGSPDSPHLQVDERAVFVHTVCNLEQN